MLRSIYTTQQPIADFATRSVVGGNHYYAPFSVDRNRLEDLRTRWADYDYLSNWLPALCPTTTPAPMNRVLDISPLPETIQAALRLLLSNEHTLFLSGLPKYRARVCALAALSQQYSDGCASYLNGATAVIMAPPTQIPTIRHIFALRKTPVNIRSTRRETELHQNA